MAGKHEALTASVVDDEPTWDQHLGNVFAGSPPPPLHSQIPGINLNTLTGPTIGVMWIYLFPILWGDLVRIH